MKHRTDKLYSSVRTLDSNLKIDKSLQLPKNYIDSNLKIIPTVTIEFTYQRMRKNITITVNKKYVTKN